MGNRVPLLVVVLLLLAANAALAWHLHRWTRSNDAEAALAKVVVKKTGRPQLEPIARFEMPSDDRFSAIIQRPLFSQSRRPPLAIERPTDHQVNDLNVALTGIAQSMAKRIVLLRPEGSGEIVLLEEGQDYDGWILFEIGSKYATFRSGAREVVLELVFDIEQGRMPEIGDEKEVE